jgi:hypothetical protein
VYRSFYGMRIEAAEGAPPMPAIPGSGEVRAEHLHDPAPVKA